MFVEIPILVLNERRKLKALQETIEIRKEAVIIQTSYIAHLSITMISALKIKI